MVPQDKHCQCSRYDYSGMDTLGDKKLMGASVRVVERSGSQDRKQ